MRRLLVVAAIVLLTAEVRADQGWQDNQDGNGFACFDVASLQVNNLAGTGTRCLAADANGNVIPMSVPCGGTGTVTSVTGTAPISCSPSSPNPVCSLATDGVTLTLNGSSQLQRAALTGDATASAGSNAVTVRNIPNDTTMPGDILASLSNAPATPAVVHMRLWCDSLNDVFSAKDPAGIVTHTARSQVAVAHKFMTSLSDGGAFAVAQPDYSDLTGTVPAITALTHDVTAAGTGSVSANVVAMEPDVLARGDMLMTAISRPADPATGFGRCWFDATSFSLVCSNEFGITTHGVQTSVGANFVTGIRDDGTVVRSGINYSQVAGLWPVSWTGNLDCTGMPSLSGGDLSSPAGTCTPAVISVYNSNTATDYGFGPSWVNGDCLAIDAISNTIVTTPCGGGGGTVTSVSGGTAISISGTPTVAPVVNAQVDATTVTVNGSNQLQRGALAGDVSAAAGSNTVNVTAVESAANAKGYVDWTAMSAPANPTGTTTREYNSLFGAGLVTLDNLGVGRYMSRDITCSANNWASSISGGTLACSQPAFSSLSGAASCAQLPAFTTDLSSAGGTCAVTVVGVESNAAMRGVLVANQVATPGAPSASLTKIYSDSNGTVSAEDPSGNISHTFRTTTCVANTWASTFANSGAIACTQPSFSSLSGTVTCSQMPALTGGVTSSAGSCATSLDGPSVAAATTKLTYSLQLQLGSSTPNTWLLEGGPGLWSNGAVIEYPNNFKANRIQVIWYLRSNTVLTGTLSLFAAMNGAGIGGTGFSVTSSTSAGVHVGTNLPTGSTSSSDTYGLVFTTDSLFSSASPSAAFLTVEVMLMP